MSIAELKLAIIGEVSNLNDEKSLKEVLAILAEKAQAENANGLNLSQHYEGIKEQYGKVLEKLAK